MLTVRTCKRYYLKVFVLIYFIKYLIRTNKIRNNDFNSFISNINKVNFNDNLFENLNKAGVNLSNPSFNKVMDIMKDEIKILFATMDSVDTPN